MASSQFHIQLDGVELTPEQKKVLAADIDKLVSTHLARLDLRGDYAVTRPLVLNREWLGIWLRSLKLGKIEIVQKGVDFTKTLSQLPQNPA